MIQKTKADLIEGRLAVHGESLVGSAQLLVHGLGGRPLVPF
jgi:hypothetical protein